MFGAVWACCSTEQSLLNADGGEHRRKLEETADATMGVRGLMGDKHSRIRNIHFSSRSNTGSARRIKLNVSSLCVKNKHSNARSVKT